MNGPLFLMGVRYDISHYFNECVYYSLVSTQGKYSGRRCCCILISNEVCTTPYCLSRPVAVYIWFYRATCAVYGDNDYAIASFERSREVLEGAVNGGGWSCRRRFTYKAPCLAVADAR
ncbi:hypothetical protein D3C72_1055530 [compost metagenome]